MLNIKKLMLSLISRRVELRSLASIPYSVTANGHVNINLGTLINSQLQAGETCVGIVGFTSNNPSVIIWAVRMLDSDFSLRVKNLSGTAITSSCAIDYLVFKQ